MNVSKSHVRASSQLTLFIILPHVTHGGRRRTLDLMRDKKGRGKRFKGLGWKRGGGLAESEENWLLFSAS